MPVLFVVYIVAGVAGLIVGTSMPRPARPRRLEDVLDSGGLLVTLVIGVSAAATGTGGGLMTSLGWFVLGWTAGVYFERRW